MTTEQERSNFDDWYARNMRSRIAARESYLQHLLFEAWIGRAALQSQDRADAGRWRKAKSMWRIFRLEILPGVTAANRNGIPWEDLETQVDIAIDRARRDEENE